MFYKNIFFYGFWLFLTILLAYWFSYPLDAFSRHNFFFGKDQVPSLWVLNWQLTQLSSGNFDQLFTGNSFYPLDRPIYFNVSTFSTALFTLPVFLSTKDPYICYAVAIFSSYILCSAGMLLLARHLKLGYAASFLATLVFSFSESRHGVSGYIHLLTIQWMPFTLLFVHKYFDEGRRVFLYWASIFYLMQIMASAYHGIFFSMILLLFVCVLVFQQDNFRFKKFSLDAGPPILIVGMIASIYFIPYLKEAHEFGFIRTIAEQSAFGAPLTTFFSLPSSYFFGSLTSHFNHIDGNTSPRYLPMLMTVAALLILRKATPIKFLFSSKLKKLALGVIILTPIVWILRSSIATLGGEVYSDLYLHPQLVNTAIFTPFFLITTGYFFTNKFFRKIYQGLRLETFFLLYCSIAMLAFVVSLGPIVKLYGNQHFMVNPIATFLYYVFPGLSSVRGISRMAILIPLGLGITAGISYEIIRDWLDKPFLKKIFSFSVLIILILELYPAKGLYAPYKQPRNEIPEEYTWLKQAPSGPVLEWPVSKTFLGDAVYLERSMVHQKKLINGYAAFEWEGRKKLAELTDLSNKSALLSLYAFGVRYLVIHRIGGDFPEWAGKNLGEFDQIKVFNNALVYQNKNAKTNFLPQNFLDYCAISVKNTNDKHRLILRFNSPSVHYVSKNKKQLRVRIDWEPDSISSYYEWSFYPTLWRDGDSYELILDESTDRVLGSVKLAYSASEKKNM